MILKQDGIKVHINLTRGDSGVLNLKCTNGETSYLETGDVLYLTVKKDIYTKDIIFQKLITNFYEDSAIIEIQPENTKNLDYGVYKYDIQLTKVDGTINTLIPPSDFVVSGEVTYE